MGWEPNGYGGFELQIAPFTLVASESGYAISANGEVVAYRNEPAATEANKALCLKMFVNHMTSLVEAAERACP